MPMLIVNVAYLAYSLLWTSPKCFIITETKAESGDALEFNTIDEVLEKLMHVLRLTYNFFYFIIFIFLIITGS